MMLKNAILAFALFAAAVNAQLTEETPEQERDLGYDYSHYYSQYTQPTSYQPRSSYTYSHNAYVAPTPPSCFHCPSPSFAINSCPSNFGDCKCPSHLVRTNGGCASPPPPPPPQPVCFHCPSPSQAINNCPANFGDCQCPHPYIRTSNGCVTPPPVQCFPCPAGSSAAVSCPSSFGQCRCMNGLLRTANGCVAPPPVVPAEVECPGGKMLGGKMNSGSSSSCGCGKMDGGKMNSASGCGGKMNSRRRRNRVRRD